MQPDILEHFLGHARIKKLSEEDGLSCEGLITIEESVKALDTFEKGKIPGNDGMPSEFHRTFWSSVGELMFNTFNFSFDSGEMSSSQKEAIITFIDKKCNDRMYLENWTPISSVNADSKLASKVSQHNQKGSSSNNPPQLIRFYRG